MPDTNKRGLLLVNPSRLIADGLECLLAEEEELEVLAEASGGKEAVEAIARHNPDLVIMEANLPDSNVADLITEAREANPAVRFLVISSDRKPKTALPILRAGAAGHLGIDCTEEELLQAIRTVLDGGRYYSEAAMRALRMERQGKGDCAVYDNLTSRERRVLKLVADGLSSKAIAGELHVTAATIDSHRHNIMRKLEVDSIAELVKVAIREGLTTLDL